MRTKWLLAVFLPVAALAAGVATPAYGPMPGIKSLLKPAVYERVTTSRDVMTHAEIDHNRYSFYAAMKVHARLSETRSVLTDYELYSKLVSYVKTARYNPSTHLLEIIGTFMGWTMHSWVRFEERGDRWIHYTFVGGHFKGMSGDMYFEPISGKDGDSSIVYMGGGLFQSKWPPIPKTILEWGAEIVFEFTGSHMRSYIESKASGKLPGNSHDQNIPQPRSHL